MVSDRKLGQLTTTYESSAGGAYIFNNQASEYVYVGSGGTHNIDASPVTEDNIFDVYLPEVMSYSDYYPFLMQMPGRNGNTDAYRYAGQGQEQDNEIHEGALSFEYRVSDARIGRFLSVDPLRRKYPANSPYAFSENRVIANVEVEGLEAKDAKGNVIAIANGEPELVETIVSESIDESTGIKTTIIVGQVMSPVFIFAESSGKPIQAYVIDNAGFYSIQEDKDGKFLSQSDNKIVIANGEIKDKSAYETISNCHGYAIANTNIWIEEADLLANEDYQKVKDASSADFVMFYSKDKLPLHSAKKNKDGTYNAKDGARKVEKNLTLKQAQGQYTNTQPVFYRKKDYRKKEINEKGGDVVNGVRLLNSSPELIHISAGLMNIKIMNTKYKE